MEINETILPSPKSCFFTDITSILPRICDIKQATYIEKTLRELINYLNLLLVLRMSTIFLPILIVFGKVKPNFMKTNFTNIKLIHLNLFISLST